MKNKKITTAIVIAVGAVLTTGVVAGTIAGVSSGMETINNLITEKEWTMDMKLSKDSVAEWISEDIKINMNSMEKAESSKIEETTKKEEQGTNEEKETSYTEEITTEQQEETSIQEEITSKQEEQTTKQEEYTKKEEPTTKKEDNTNVYEFVEIVITHREEPATKAPVKLTLEDRLEMDKGSYENGYYKDDKGTMIYINRQRDDDVMQAKNKWIKENFGTSFTHNGIEFMWDDKENAFYRIEQYGNIHYMTSTTTSIEGKYLRKSYSYRIADYLGFYGLDFALYNNEAAFNYEIFIWEGRELGMNVSEPYINNLAYLKELGWTEVIEEGDVSKDWKLESPEGVPAKIMTNGDIAIYVKRPDASKETLEYFTIEEYNKFISNNNWIVSSRRGARGFEFEPQENWQKYIRKYVKINDMQ